MIWLSIRLRRTLLHINDAAEAYIAALEAPESKVHSKIFNVLSDNFKILKVAYEVRRTLESEKGIHLALEIQQVGMSRSYRVSGEKFNDTFGLPLVSPMHTAVSEIWDGLEDSKEVVDGLAETSNWLTSHRIQGIMSILTIVMALLAPATLIASIFGMNIPLPGGINGGSLVPLIVIGSTMLLISVGMFAYLRHHHWF